MFLQISITGFRPHILILIVTAGISIWAFQDRSVIGKFVMYPYEIFRRKEWYRIITHAFIHADGMHLLFNMFTLFFFGGVVTTMFSYVSTVPHVHFFVMYFSAIVVASASDLVKNKDNLHYMSLGASGAVSAVVFASIFFDPWNLIYVFFIPCPGIIFGIIYLWYSSYMSKQGRDNIAHDAHLYGSIFGFLYPLFVEPQLIKHFVDRLLHPQFF